MDQTAIIAAAIIVAFIVFITSRGELSQYLALFKGNSNNTTAPSVLPSFQSVLNQYGTGASGI